MDRFFPHLYLGRVILIGFFVAVWVGALYPALPTIGSIALFAGGIVSLWFLSVKFWDWLSMHRAIRKGRKALAALEHDLGRGDDGEKPGRYV